MQPSCRALLLAGLALLPDPWGGGFVAPVGALVGESLVDTSSPEVGAAVESAPKWDASALPQGDPEPLDSALYLNEPSRERNGSDAAPLHAAIEAGAEQEKTVAPASQTKAGLFTGKLLGMNKTFWIGVTLLVLSYMMMQDPDEDHLNPLKKRAAQVGSTLFDFLQGNVWDRIQSRLPGSLPFLGVIAMISGGILSVGVGIWKEISSRFLYNRGHVRPPALRGLIPLLLTLLVLGVFFRRRIRNNMWRDVGGPEIMVFNVGAGLGMMSLSLLLVSVMQRLHFHFARSRRGVGETASTRITEKDILGESTPDESAQ